MAYGSYQNPSVPTICMWAAYRTWDTVTPQFDVQMDWQYAQDVANRKFKVKITKIRFREPRQLVLGGCTVELKCGWSTSSYASGTLSLAQNFGPPYYVEMAVNREQEYSYNSDGSVPKITFYYSAKVNNTADVNIPKMTSMRACGNGTSTTVDSASTVSGTGTAYYYNCDLATVIPTIAAGARNWGANGNNLNNLEVGKTYTFTIDSHSSYRAIAFLKIGSLDAPRRSEGYDLNDGVASGTTSDNYMICTEAIAPSATTFTIKIPVAYMKNWPNSNDNPISGNLHVNSYSGTFTNAADRSGYVGGTSKSDNLQVKPGFNVYYNDNGTWRRAKQVWYNDNGTWRKAKAIYYNDNGTWRRNR